MLAPTEPQYNVMEHLVRRLSTKCTFPLPGQIEEDVNMVLEIDMTQREKFFVKQLILNNLKVIELYFHLRKMTTKPEQK